MSWFLRLILTSFRTARRPTGLFGLFCSGLFAVQAAAQISITAQPQPVTVPAGQSATFRVTVAAGSAPTYQWRRSGYPLPGATQASLTLPAISQFDNDLYDVVVTSGDAATVSQPARLQATLPSYPNAISVDPTRSIRLEGTDDGHLTAQAAMPDGRYYVAGDFTSVGGVVRSNLVRLNSNGTIDSTFAPPAFDVTPRTLALQPDGKLIVAGSFKSVGGVPTGSIVRLNADGSRDNTFAVGSGFTIGVSDALLAPDGSIYVVSAGTLGSYKGSGPLEYVAHLTSTGELYTNFKSPTFSVGISGTNPNFFAVDPTGALYIAGGFDRVNEVTRNRLVRLLPNGEVDLAFNPGSGPNTWIYALVALSNGQVAIAGDFTAYNGTPVGHIARLKTDGTLDPSFATGDGFAMQVAFLAELPNGALFCGSIGNSFNGTGVGCAVRLTATGALDPTFAYTLNNRPDGLSLLPGNRMLLRGASVVPDNQLAITTIEANGAVVPNTRPSFRFAARARFLAHLPGGKILAAGDFRYANGASAPYVLRLNADLTLDPTFPNGPGPASLVVTGLVQPDGKIVLFTYGSGMLRLNADGSIDPTFATPSTYGYWYPSPPIMLPDGNIFVITDSPFWASSPPPHGFVILDKNGNRVTSHPLLPGPPEGTRIFSAQLTPSGQLLVTGNFSSWNGVARDKIVRLKTDGSVDNSFTLDPSFTANLYRFYLPFGGPAYQRDGRIVGMSDWNYLLARFNLDGSRDQSFGGVQPGLFDAGRLLVQPDDRVIMVAQGNPPPRSDGELPIIFSRFTRDGAVDGTFLVSGSGFWTAALLADNGELVSSDGTGFLHRYRATPPPTITVQPASQSVTAGTSTTLRVTATGAGTLTYQWQKDGIALPGATNPILSLDNVAGATSGNYTVTITSATGSVTSQAATVSITARPLAGTYFGAIEDSAGGTFALLVREDGSGVFLGHTRNDPSTPVALIGRDVVIDANRHFRFGVVATTALQTTEDVVDGTISLEGNVTGTIVGLARGLTGQPAAVGATGSFGGFYQAGEIGRASAAYAIVEPSGRVYALTVQGQPFAFTGTLGSSGSLSLSSAPEFKTRIDLAFRAGTPFWSATVVPPAPATPYTFSGANNETRDDLEKLVNLSTRSEVRPGQSFTAGFVIAGDQPKPVLVRAIGPTLSVFNVGHPLPAVHIDVYRDQTLVASGNDWGQAGNFAQIAVAAQRVGAFGLPGDSRDAALLLNLAPGAYSVIVSGQDGAAGVALAEVYDATEGAIPRSRRLIDISTLASAGADAATLISGFVINGTVPKRVLIRGAGPALRQFGVSGVLSRPVVSVYSGNTQLATNAGWSAGIDPGALAIAAKEVGAFAFPNGSQDAALVIALAPGTYTAQVTGLNGDTGTALVEVYELR